MMRGGEGGLVKDAICGDTKGRKGSGMTTPSSI